MNTPNKIYQRSTAEDLEAARVDLLELQRDFNAIEAENHRLKALINTPELDNFLRAVHLEAIHQVERWGTASDRAKRPADWFWLVGYLAGKALHAALGLDQAKALHHCISTAAALYNWHCAIKGTGVRMCPGSSDVARIVDQAFPGEAERAVCTCLTGQLGPDCCEVHSA